MSAKLKKKYRLWKMGFVLFLSFLIVSASLYLSTPVLADLAIDPRRADMLSIADMYANYTWTAAETNLVHYPYSGRLSGDTYESCLYEVDSTVCKTINVDGSISNIFPGANIKWEYIHNVHYVEAGQDHDGAQVNTPDWIHVGQNIGIPYAWGLSTPIDGIPANPATGEPFFIPSTGSFNQRIAAGLFAGNMDISSPAGNQLLTAGVDCVGLINNAWRMGNRVGMWDLKPKTLPIKFKDLKPGDILMDEAEHVMLFEKFDNYDPSLGGEPGAGTKFWVYEASGEVWRVRYWSYTLTGTPTTNSNNEEIVTIGGLSYTPRTKIDLAPMDIVLVIDKSGSMIGDKLAKAQEAARQIVGFLRPGDKLGIVAFNSTSDIVYPPTSVRGLQLITSDNENQIKADAKQAIIDNISAGGATVIDAGLEHGIVDLSYGTSDMKIEQHVFMLGGENVFSWRLLSISRSRKGFVVATLVAF